MSLVQQWQVDICKAKEAPVESERELIERAKQDREAFSKLYTLHFQAISNYVFHRTGDVHAMEDLVSDVFLTALRKLPRFRYQGVPLRFWLLRIATNAVNRWARRKRRHLNLKLEADQLVDTSSAGASRKTEIDKALALRALLSLSPKHQAVLTLHYLEGLTIKEAAAVLKCREGTVKSRLARARNTLRNKLDRRRDYHERI